MNKSKEIILVHSSDLHVDDGYTARQWGGDANGPLRAVLDTASHVEADVVVLAGDIFEHNRLPKSVLRETREILKKYGREVVLLPGNHDPLTQDSVWLRGRIYEPNNVHVLGISKKNSVSFSDLDLQVSGKPHRDYEDMSPLEKPQIKKNRWQIILAHGHYEAKPNLNNPLRPSWIISAEQILQVNASYLALGHWNTAKRVGGRGAHAYYSGSPDIAGTVNQVSLSSKGTKVKKIRVNLANQILE